MSTFYTAAELARRGPDDIPESFSTARHLVYSSPATLAFNSPGAEGFGVKRAGLAVPGSVMLIVSPGCCGRNTSEISSIPQYRHRFFYYEIQEPELVTGQHLKRIPEAVDEVCRSLPEKPSVVMICATCVDALLGTDFDRVCRAAEARSGVKVRPCYMYALTREGKKPPMVQVRQSLYSLLEPRTRKGADVNLLGFFAPLDDDAELYAYLRGCGVRNIREISRCEDWEAFQQMASANFNLVLNPEARAAADDLSERLGMPYIELSQLYRIDKIHSQYQALASAIGGKIDDAADLAAARQAIETFRAGHPGLRFAVGECLNANPFELSLALTEYGFTVSEIYATAQSGYYRWIDRLAVLSPETRIYCNQDPSMLFYEAEQQVDVTLGKDAAFYHPGKPNLAFNSDRQPFGYEAVQRLFRELGEVLG
ncbi:MAG: oxidoreductase [Oscillospiraceae bacterium]|nr:oxidoreductase [Oscillospiraceae bacterium]